jgi:neutral amino acid transport system permease protein
VWVLAGALAALGGVLFGLSELGGTVQYEMGFNLLLLMFAGVILGGLGTAYGALVGCLIVGVLVQVSAQIIPVDLKYLGGLAVLIVILYLLRTSSEQTPAAGSRGRCPAMRSSDVMLPASDGHGRLS